MDLSTSLLPLLNLAGWIVAGAIGVFGVFNGQWRQRRAEDDSTATNLINNLRTTTELQEKEIVALRAKEVEQGREIAHLQGQVKILSEVMQGRDPAMQKFLTDAPTLMTIAKENNGLAKETAHALNGLADAITAFVTASTKQ